ncbi:hypothetical protein ACWEO4_44510 [Streptomyces sp. NPDC004393]
MSAPQPRIDAALFRRTYKAVLEESRIASSALGSEEQRAHLAGLLRGQLRVLVVTVNAQAAQLHGSTLATAEHVITRAGEALAMGTAEARAPEHVHDMAVLTRALLTLHELAAPARPLTSSVRI